jgi:hypothetical protein
LTRKFIKIADFFFENLRIRNKYAVQCFLRNKGKLNVRIDTKLPDDIKVVEIKYNPAWANSIVVVESEEFFGESEEIQLQCTRIAIEVYRERERVSFT